MKCPPEIQDNLLRIIFFAAGNIMKAGQAGDAKQCDAEAEHIYNIPQIISHYKPRHFLFYWRDTRPRFIERSQGKDISIFNLAWEKLEPIAEQMTVQT